MKPELAARIREVARQAGFHPNQAAATLRTGASKMIGVSLPTPRNLRNAELAAALHHEITAHGYLPFFAFHENYGDQQAKIIPLLSGAGGGRNTGGEPPQCPPGGPAWFLAALPGTPRISAASRGFRPGVN